MKVCELNVIPDKSYEVGSELELDSEVDDEPTSIEGADDELDDEGVLIDEEGLEEEGLKLEEIFSPAHPAATPKSMRPNRDRKTFSYFLIVLLIYP